MRVLLCTRDLKGSEPMGLLQLGAVLRAAGHEVRLADLASRGWLLEAVAFRPGLVGLGACTGEHQAMIGAARRLRAAAAEAGSAFFAVLGGPHATFFPEVVEAPGLDGICRGEGEGAILELAAALEAGRSPAGIPNLWVKTAEGVVRAGLRPRVADLDALPWPDRELRYAADPASRAYPVKSFLVSRGCPFSCTYCFNAAHHALYGGQGPRVRTRSVGSVIAEIRAVRAASPLTLVQFRESLFPWQEAWLEEWAERYPREVGLPFYAHVRADLLTPRRVALLARSGCVSVNLGIECGDEAYRREWLGRPMSNATLIEGCRLLKAHGIRILADNMLALPGAGPEVDRATLALNRACGVDYALAMLFQPYPGTALGERARALGLWDGHPDDLEESYYVRSPLRFPDPRARRRAERLQRLFALLVEVPSLERWLAPLVSRAPDLVLLSIFRAWFMYAYLRRIVPHPIGRQEALALARTLFAVPSLEETHDVA